jgi:hypothetical protein
MKLSRIFQRNIGPHDLDQRNLSYPNLRGGGDRQFAQSDTESGVQLQDLLPGSELQVTTDHTCYQIRVLFGRIALISGHPQYCPRPVLVTIHGSTADGSMLKADFIGRGMRLKFHHPKYGAAIVTSAIQGIHKCQETDRWPLAFIA